MTVKLSKAALQNLPEKVGVPGYSQSDLKAGIIHFGIGNFHRAHQAVYLDALFNAGTDHEWGLVGAGVLASDEVMRQKLKEQDWLTTVVEQDSGHRVCACHVVDDRLSAAWRHGKHHRTPCGSRNPHRFDDDHRGRLFHRSGFRCVQSRSIRQSWPMPPTSQTRKPSSA